MRFWKVTATSLGTTARVLLAQLRGGGNNGDDNNAESYDGAEVLQPLGFFARPYITEQTEALVWEIGDENVVLGIVDKSGGGAPTAYVPFTDVGQGGARMYGPKEPRTNINITPSGEMVVNVVSGQPCTFNLSGGTVLRIEASGAVSLTVGSSQDFTVNNGTQKVAREHDSLNVGTLTATAGPYPVTFTYTRGGYPSPGAPVTGPSAVLTGIVAHDTGAQHFKA